MRGLLTFILLLAAGCSTDIDYHMSAHRLDTPETKGEFLSGEAVVSMGNDHKVTLAEVFDDVIFNNPSVDTDTAIEKSGSLGAHLNLGLLKRLDFYYRANADSTDIFGMKWQVFGDPEKEYKEGFKLAVTGGYGASKESEGELVVTNSNNSSTRNYSSTINFKVWETSLIMGHRRSPKLLLYWNNFYSRYRIKAHLDSNSISDLDIYGRSRNYGSLLGFRGTTENKRAFLQAEAGFAEGEWEKGLRTSFFTWGAALGLNW